MNSTADTDDVIEVSADGLSVRKTFTADEFPVPAIRFEIESENDEQVAFRLSEDIPESFPMDKVGFHPDYHSDDWTAFQDNHVEFTGILEPDEQFVTVYGVRIDDESDAEQFLTEPEIVEVSSEAEHGSDAETLDDDVIGTIVSDDGNQAVKDMIAGDSESVPGLEEEEDADEPTADDGDTGSASDQDDLEDEADGLDLDLGGVDPEPEPVDDESEAEDDAPEIDLGFDEDEIPEPDEAVGDGEDDESEETDLDIDLGADGDADADAPEESLEDSDDESEPEIELDLEAAAATVDEDDASVEDDADADAGTDDGDSEPAEATAATFDGSVATRLTTELREDEIDDTDLEVLRSELDLEPSGPDIAKLEHLQSRVEEVAAYTDALEQFLEDNGTGKQLLEEVQTDLESIEDDVASMDDRVGGTESRLGDVETDLDAVTADVSDVEDDVEDLTGDVADLEENVDSVEDNVETVEGDLEDVSTDLDTVEDDLEDVQAEVTDIQEWRNQLGSMFSE